MVDRWPQEQRAAVQRATVACRDAASQLREASIRVEALAAFVPASRRLLFLKKAAHMRPVGEVWRLGVLLLGTEGSLWAVGRATRAAERGRVGYQSVSREERRDLAAAALRGGYPVGAPVNFDAVPLFGQEYTDSVGSSKIEFDERSPIGFADGELRVRWRAGASLEGAPSVKSYLAERVSLLTGPPFTAS